MSDVSIKYKGVEKATLNASGSKTIKTSGKYCEADIVVEYTDPEKEEQSKSMTLSSAAPVAVTPDSGKVLSSVSPSIDTSVIKAENIKSGVNILGVSGNLTPGITPSGTKNITANGTYDVTDFASAAVAVPAPNYRKFNLTIASDLTTESLIATITDQDILSHRADESMCVILTALFAPQPGIGWFMTRNRGNNGTAKSAGQRINSSGTKSAVTADYGLTLNYCYNSGHIILKANGELRSIGTASFPLAAGNYTVEFIW